jgi:hypothetical protein
MVFGIDQSPYPGRPPHVPTDANRKMAMTLSGFGIPQEQIATELCMSVETMQKYYQAELDRGKLQANAKVAQSLYEKATGDGASAVTAAIWWSKTQMGWKETVVNELTGKDGKPIAIQEIAWSVVDPVKQIEGE